MMTYVPFKGSCPVCHHDNYNTNEAANNLFKSEQDSKHEAAMSKLTELIRSNQVSEITQLRAQLAEVTGQRDKLVEALEECNDQLRLTNTNLYKGMSRSIQRLQATENRDALTAAYNALAAVKGETK